MTDTTQTDVLVPSFSPPKAAPRSGTYLFGPLFDFLTLGGGSVVVCGLIVLLLPAGIPSLQQAVLITLLMTVINQPHFANSYQIFYRNFGEKAFGSTHPRALRLRYIIAGLVVPAILIAYLAVAAMSGNVRVLAFGANLMFFLVGWHYVKQGYGILIVDSVQKRLMFSDRAKAIFRINGYACWIVAWLGLNHAIATPSTYLGLAYFSLPIPEPIYWAGIAVAVCTTLAMAWVLFQRWREARGTLPWNGVIAYVTTLYLWVVFVRINPLVLAIVPTFHSLQYLAVVWRYQLNAGGQSANPRPSILRSIWPTGPFAAMATFVAAGVLLGFLGFMGLPRLFDAIVPYDKHLYGGGLFLFVFYIFINVHHYFLDNVMWRRGNPDVQRYIFARGPAPAR